MFDDIIVIETIAYLCQVMTQSYDSSIFCYTTIKSYYTGKIVMRDVTFLFFL